MGALKSRSKVTSILGLALAALWAAIPQALADSIVAGTIIDVLSGKPIGAIEVRVEYSGQEVGASTTDVQGHYSVSFTIPATAPSLVNMVLSASDGAHAPLKTSFQVNNGKPVRDVLDLVLLTPAVASCQSQTKHSVVVGHFLSPVNQALSSYQDISPTPWNSALIPVCKLPI
jgi:hypothetical protein